MLTCNYNGIKLCSEREIFSLYLIKYWRNKMGKEKTETNVGDFLSDLQAGKLLAKFGQSLSDAALGVVLFGNKNKKSKVTLEFVFQKVGENDQVIVSHKVSHKTPTKTGNKAEEDTTQTPMFVGRHGRLSIAPPREEHRGQLTLEKVD